MKFKAKDMEVATGGPIVVLLHEDDARKLDLHLADRVVVRKGRTKKTIAILDITDSRKSIKKGQVGLFEEIITKLKLKQGDNVDILPAHKPESLQYIRKKLDGNELSQREYDSIIRDIVNDELTEGELTFFVSACYTQKLQDKEAVRLTKAIVEHGARLNIPGKVFDKHCIGGVPGNRTTMVVVPILAAAGLKVPKTSSRSITSPAGTADTMEVLCPVTIPLKKMKSMIKKHGAFLAWGGSVNLAAADDRLIRVRKSMAIDPRGMLLASIMAKKKAVDANAVLIDIPLGPKVKNMQEANKLKRDFEKIGKALKMQVSVMITDGSAPIGKGIGPGLEARDVLWLLRRDPRAPKDLEQKALKMAERMLKMAGHKNPKQKAWKILESGQAYQKFKDIIKAQGGKEPHPDQILIGKYSHDVIAKRSGSVKWCNKCIAKLGRISGAPQDTGAGIYLHVENQAKVLKGQTILTVYAQSKKKLEFALEAMHADMCFRLK